MGDSFKPQVHERQSRSTSGRAHAGALLPAHLWVFAVKHQIWHLGA
jgi:hypothetical protein